MAGAANNETAVAYVKVTRNNISVSIATTKGDVLCWASAGSVGFKGSRKSTYVSGLATGQRAAERAREFGVVTVELRLTGEGEVANGAIAGLSAGGLKVIERP